MSDKLVSELRKEKKAELKGLIKQIKEHEKGKKATFHGDKLLHLTILRELDIMYVRRRMLTDFLREMDADRQPLLCGEEVMCFLGDEKNEVE